MTTRIGRSLALAAALSVASVHAADWSDSFTDGTFDQAWIFSNETGDQTVAAAGDMLATGLNYTATTINGYLDLNSTAGLPPTGPQNVFGFVNDNFQNVHLSGSVNVSNIVNSRGDIGLIARINPLTVTGYLMSIDLDEDAVNMSTFGGQFSIFRVTGGAVDGGTVINTELPAGFDLQDTLFFDYAVVDSIHGVEYHGNVYEDATRANLLASATAIDASAGAQDGPGVSGVFAALNDDGFPILASGLPATPVGGTFDDLTSRTIVSGDATLDGQVSASTDGAILLANLGTGGVRPQGDKRYIDADFDGDGLVTANPDGALLLAGLPADTAAVPEPASWLLLIAGLTLLAVRRR